MNQQSNTALKKYLAMDLRSLALFRIALGAIIILDLILRAKDLALYYTDGGILPRSAALKGISGYNFFSLHFITGSTFGQALLFMLAGVVALSLIAGYRTRLSTVLSWFLLLSLHSRNTVILDGGDVLFRIFLFWGMFLPLGARWSVDRFRQGKGVEDNVGTAFLSTMAVGLCIQICSVYWFTAILKSGIAWHSAGTAVHTALYDNILSTNIGIWLRQFQTLTRWLTHLTWHFEILGPFLFFIPWRRVELRTFGVVAFLLLHLGFKLCLGLGVFPLISMTGFLALIPGEVWDKLAARFSRTESISEPLYQTHGFLLQGLGIVFIACLLVLNVNSLPRFHRTAPKSLVRIARTLRLNQRWNMFAPTPTHESGWFVMPGKLENGREVDTRKFNDEQAPDWTPPTTISETFSGQRSQKYFKNFYHKKYKKIRAHFGRYLCRQWNANREGKERLETLQIVFMRQETTLDGNAPALKQNLWSHRCY